MIHGGDVITYRGAYDGRIIDFSSNINPLGPPEGLKNVLDKAYEELTSYPDIHYRELRANVAGYLRCSSDQVIAGSGAIEIISNICMMFRRTVVFAPCFTEYIKRPEVFGRDVLRLPMTRHFQIDAYALEQNLMQGDLLILGNPNNPTGNRIPEDILISICDIVDKKESFLLLDEAFFEFCPDDYDSIRLLNGRRNVCIIRAATKFFALPGIRLGYAFGDHDFIRRYREVEAPWSINSYANAAARCIFKDRDYVKRTRDYIKNEREYMFHELSTIDTIKAYKSQTNFILIKLLKNDECHVFDNFLKRGIMIRKASDFEGLDKSFIRIAVKDHESNMRIIDCFKELV